MNRNDQHSQNVTTLSNLQTLTTAHTRGGWQHLLASYAEKGYPTGQTAGHGSDVNRPTENFALTPDSPALKRQRRALAIEIELSHLAHEYRAIMLWTTTTVTPLGDPVPCNNPQCPKTITNLGYDIARLGRCARCAQHHRRHQTDWPLVAAKESETGAR